MTDNRYNKRENVSRRNGVQDVCITNRNFNSVIHCSKFWNDSINSNNPRNVPRERRRGRHMELVWDTLIKLALILAIPLALAILDELKGHH